MPKRSKHPIERSRLYHLRSKKELARILNTSVSALESLLSKPKQYRVFTPPGTERECQEPLGELKRLQKRLHELLMRINPPGYLFSPALGHSNITNAAFHKHKKVTRTLDIKKFFPSTRTKRVYLFFRHGLGCTDKISHILTEICVKEDGLPTGGPISPIMAFYAYKPMWEEIETLCIEANVIFSVYVDDLTISGDTISGELLGKIKRVIRSYGLRYHTKAQKQRKYREGQAKEITGVIVKNGKLALPNRLYKELAPHQEKKESNLASKEKISQRIRGLENYRKQILVNNT